MESDTREFYFQFHILKNCNLRCKHCYQEEYGKYSPTDLASGLGCIAGHIVSAVRKWNMKARVALTGGEPLLSPSFWNLLRYFNDSEDVSTLTVLSNGTLISPETAVRLASFRKLREVQVSLDGSNAKTHDAIRGSGAFEAALNGIRRLKAANIPVAVMFTMMRQNIGEIGTLLELTDRESVDYLTVERVVPCAGNAFNPVDMLTSDEVKSAFSMVNSWNLCNAHSVHVRRRRPLWALLGDDCGGFCPIGLSALAILEDGTILPCRRLEIPIGNVIEDNGFFKAWYSSDLLWKIREKRNLKGRCHGCSLLEKCGGCRAIAYNTTGDYLEGDPQCWMTSRC